MTDKRELLLSYLMFFALVGTIIAPRLQLEVLGGVSFLVMAIIMFVMARVSMFKNRPWIFYLASVQLFYQTTIVALRLDPIWVRQLTTWLGIS